MLALERLIEVLHDLYDSAGCRAAAIAGDGHEVEGYIHVMDALRELTHEHRAALQDADEVKGLALIGLGNLIRNFCDTCFDLILRDQDSDMLSHDFFSFLH